MFLLSRFFGLLLLLTAALAVNAQADSTWYLSFAGTGSINTTDESTAYIFNNLVKCNLNTRYVSVNTLNSYVFGENESVKTNNDFMSVADVDLLKNQHPLYYWALASYEKSFSLNLDDRFQAGAGAAFRILNGPHAKLVISDGPVYESSRFSIPDRHGRLHYETLRNSLRLKFHFVIRDLFVLDGVDFLQNALSDREDYNIRSNTTLSFRLTRWLSLTTTATYNKLYLTGSQNFLLTYGLMMERYF